MVRAKSQSHYFSPDSNVSLELGNFGEPCPPSSTRSAHTHARTDHKCNFSITFFSSLGPPTSLPAPIDPDRPQTKGGSADSYSQRFIQGARRGSPTAAPPPRPAMDVSWRRNLTSSRLERANSARCQSAQLASGRTFLHARVQ